jgi:hypothetical protein
MGFARGHGRRSLSRSAGFSIACQDSAPSIVANGNDQRVRDRRDGSRKSSARERAVGEAGRF